MKPLTLLIYNRDKTRQIDGKPNRAHSELFKN